MLIGFGTAALLLMLSPAEGFKDLTAIPLFVFYFPIMVLLTLGPLFISLGIAAISPGRGPQITLITGSIMYALWIAFVCLDAFYWNIDPQSVIALLFIGIYSLPVMIPIWIISFALWQENKT